MPISLVTCVLKNIAVVRTPVLLTSSNGRPFVDGIRIIKAVIILRSVVLLRGPTANVGDVLGLEINIILLLNVIDNVVIMFNEKGRFFNPYLT